MLPKDPNMLLSIINLKLRDFYPSFTVLCGDMEVNEDEIKASLGKIGYFYQEQLNQFVAG